MAAQQGVADSSLWMMLTAILTVPLTKLGVMLLWRTVFFTHEALKEAQKATVAAEAAVAETRRVGEAQVRAYVSFNSVQMQYIQSDAGTFTRIRFRPNIINTGQSPALMQHLATYANVFKEIPGEILLPMSARRTTAIRVGSGRSIFIEGDIIEWDDVMEAQRAKHHIILCGMFEFLDVFGLPHRDNFCVLVTPTRPFVDPTAPIDRQPPGRNWHEIRASVVFSDERAQDAEQDA